MLYHDVDDVAGPGPVGPEAEEQRSDSNNGHGQYLVPERVQIDPDHLEFRLVRKTQHGHQAPVDLVQLLLPQLGSGARAQRAPKFLVEDDGADAQTESAAKDPSLRHGALGRSQVVVVGFDGGYHGAGGKGQPDAESVDGGKPQQQAQLQIPREAKHQSETENLHHAPGNQRLAGEVGLLGECASQEGAERARAEHWEEVDARPERAVAVDKLETLGDLDDQGNINKAAEKGGTSKSQ